MKIVLSGVETNNKGAELMLYAILQEIEKRNPQAIVYIPRERIKQGLGYVNTRLDFRLIPFEDLEKRLHMNAIYRRFHIPFKYLPHLFMMGKIDYYIDGSGYRYSDYFNITSYWANIFDFQLSAYREKGAKVIFLPQAFGPFREKCSRKALTVINKNASVVMPRESVSYNNLKESGLIGMDKVKMFPDFTSLVEGVFPDKYKHLKNAICIIPNSQMINKGSITEEDYIDFLNIIVSTGVKTDRQVFLLNHEGIEDERLCNVLQERLSHKVEFVTGLNALEVKGLIAASFLVISSRFHGVASALNSSVPCLATSWSYKYKELFNDYCLNDCIMPLDNIKKAQQMISEFLQESRNQDVRNILNNEVPRIKEYTRKMWKVVWSY